MLCAIAASAHGAPADDLAAVEKTPPVFIVGDRSDESVQFIDVGRVLRLDDGTLATHNYVVLKDPRYANGRAWSYGDLVVQYDCRSGTIVVRSGLLIGEDFAQVGALQLPAGGRRWVAADDPDVARTYGYPDLCHTGSAPSPLIGKGEPWRAVAASLLAGLRTR
jgi:hypothetical protein